jgi:hypothetical protein
MNVHAEEIDFRWEEVLEWKKPTICFYHERFDKPETKPFAVVKAQKITLQVEADEEFNGGIADFFTLCGDVDCISSPNGKRDQYILCWFDDNIEDFSKAFRKLRNVTFPSGLSCRTSGRKRTYSASFQAKSGKVS